MISLLFWDNQIPMVICWKEIFVFGSHLIYNRYVWSIRWGSFKSIISIIIATNWSSNALLLLDSVPIWYSIINKFNEHDIEYLT